MILPGGIIGGAPLLPVSVTSLSHVQVSGGPTFTISGISWGDVVKGRNRRSVVVMLAMFDTEFMSGTPTINGVTAPIIYDGVSGGFIRHVAFSADIPTGASGDVVFSTTTTSFQRVAILKTINLDVSTEVNSSIASGTGIATMSTDCPAGGAILGHGYYAYSSGGTPNTANFNNLDTLAFFSASASQGHTAAARVFASAQTGLSVSYDPAPNTNINRSHGFSLSFATSF